MFKKGHTPWNKGTKGIMKAWNKRYEPIIKKCLVCSKKIKTFLYRIKTKHGKYCSRKCWQIDRKNFRFSEEVKKKMSIDRQREKSWNFKGIKINRRYIYIYIPKHPNAKNSYVALHHLIMENFIGRFIQKGEVVHHINNNPSDNRIKNLKLFTRVEHSRFHRIHFLKHIKKHKIK